jgi:hypothetical protein
MARRGSREAAVNFFFREPVFDVVLCYNVVQYVEDRVIDDQDPHEKAN